MAGLRGGAWFCLLIFGSLPRVASDGNLTISGFDVDGNLFKEAGLTRRFDPQDPKYISHLIWIAMPGLLIHEHMVIVGFLPGVCTTCLFPSSFVCLPVCVA